MSCNTIQQSIEMHQWGLLGKCVNSAISKYHLYHYIVIKGQNHILLTTISRLTWLETNPVHAYPTNKPKWCTCLQVNHSISYTKVTMAWLLDLLRLSWW